jgi:hypothetical protein
MLHRAILFAAVVSPLCTLSAPQQICFAGKMTSQPLRRSTRTVALLTSLNSSGMTQPLSMATLARRLPMAGKIVASGLKKRREIGGNIDSIFRNRSGNNGRIARGKPLC